MLSPCAEPPSLRVVCGGRGLHLVVPDDRLRPIFERSFRHLSPWEGERPLTVRIHREGPRVARPSAAVWREIGSFREAGDRVLAGTPADPRLGIWSRHAAWLLDREDDRLDGWLSDAHRPSLFEVGKPFLPLHLAWLGDQGVLPVHGACVARDGAGVLIGGVGGSGKTTTALACARRGWSYLADDYVGITEPSNAPVAWSLYGSAFLEPSHARRFQWTAPHLLKDGEAEDEKWLLPVAEVPGVAAATRAPLRVLLLPVVRGTGPTELRRIGPGEALRRLSPSSIFQQPFASRHEAFAAMAELTTRLPAFDLALGADLDGIPDVVERALAEG